MVFWYYCDPDNDLTAKDARCGGGKTEEPERESNQFDSCFCSSVLLLLLNLFFQTTLLHPHATRNLEFGPTIPRASLMEHVHLEEQGTSHDASVVTATYATKAANDTLVITKNINAAAIANEHGGTFIFCETVTLTDTGVSETYDYDVVYAKTQYAIVATFLADS